MCCSTLLIRLKDLQHLIVQCCPYHYLVYNNMTVKLTVQVTLMCSCAVLGKTTRAVTLKSGATQQEANNNNRGIIEKQTGK